MVMFSSTCLWFNTACHRIWLGTMKARVSKELLASVALPACGLPFKDRLHFAKCSERPEKKMALPLDAVLSTKYNDNRAVKRRMLGL